MDLGQEPLHRQIEKLLSGEIVLPDIQRDFVWSGTQIPRLLDSLNQEWPVGSILLWQTSLDIPTKHAAVIQGKPVGVVPAILLDGQQRLTTLARVMAPDRIPIGDRVLDVRFNPELGNFETPTPSTRTIGNGSERRTFCGRELNIEIWSVHSGSALRRKTPGRIS